MEVMTRAQKRPETERGHDMLSFLSVIVHEYTNYDLDFTLLGVTLNEAVMDMRQVGPAGGYFSVYKANGKSLLKRRPFDMGFGAKENLFPDFVAIKSPIIKGEVNSSRNRKIWTAMAQELMILRHPYLSRHENVVSLLGVCWHNSGTETPSVMPAFVLEAAEMDLEVFMAPGKGVATRKLLGLAIDIVAGVQAIHDSGIAHCDLKPKNILICKHEDLGYTAKIADFGCAVLLSTIKDKIMPSGATEFWQAPESSQPLSGEGLKQADMYSAGLIVWNILTANLALIAMERFGRHDLYLDDDTPDDADPKKVILPYLIRETVDANWDFPTKYFDSGEEIEAPKKSDILDILIWTLCVKPETRDVAKTLLKNLRLLLHQFMKYQVFANLTEPDDGQDSDKTSDRSPTKFNPQEQDIWLDPSLDEPTEEDRQRIMGFAKSMEWMNEAFAAIKSSRRWKMKDLATYEPTNPEKHVGTTLRRWENAKLAAPDAQREVRDSFAVVEADHSFGTFRLIPRPVVEQVYQQLQIVALNTKEPKERRAKAAYQYVILGIGRLQLHENSSAEIARFLEMSLLAANLGHVGAQSITSSLCSAFRKGQSQQNARMELGWLRRGVKNGSLAAKRRLQDIDPELFLSAKHALRRRYAGTGTKLPWQYKYATDSDFEKMLQKALGSESQSERAEILFALTIHGRTLQVEQLLGEVNVNSSNEWKETPLLAACRIGDAEMVRMLLDSGADPSIASVEGVTPLHFLAAFEDADINPIAQRLFETKAPLEARSSHGRRYCNTYDSTFGQADGTPLLWAVAADNWLATAVLVKLGADPFDLAGRNAPRNNTFGNLSWTSPAIYAATKHQYYLLEVMLAPQKKSPFDTLKSLWLPSTKHKLNDNRRDFGTEGVVDNSSPLDYCVTYAAEGLVKRLLLHGAEHEIAFVKTFEVLIRAGADPFHRGNEEDSVMVNAVMHGQPFVINYLMGWNDNLLRPNPSQWLRLLKLAISLSDHVVYQTLLQHSRAEELDAQSLKEFFGFMAANSDETCFLEPFEAFRDPVQDFADAFEVSLMHGNTKVSKWFYTTGLCDISRQRDGRSVLGTLIRDSKTFHSRMRSIEVLLSLDGLPNKVFYECFDLFASQLTALQLAVLHFEYWEGKKTAEWAVHMIVERWNEPIYLNYQVAGGRYKGCTAMHLAVQHTNVAAVRYLLDEERDSLDLSILDGRDCTVLDLALLQLSDQKKTMDFWEVPPEKQVAADEQHWSNTVLIIVSLSEAGAKSHRFASAWVRPEPDVLMVFDAHLLKERAFPLMPQKVEEARELFATTVEQRNKLPPVLREAAGLQVNKALFLTSEEYALAKISETPENASISRQEAVESDNNNNMNPQGSDRTSLLEDEADDNGLSLRALVGQLQLEE